MIRIIMVIMFVASNPLGNLLSLNQKQADITGYVNQLRSSNSEERAQAVKSILQLKSGLNDRVGAIRLIEKVAREMVDQTKAGPAKSAIYLLGELQAVESVPFLTENITFEVYYKDSKRPQTMDDRFPCTGALIKIGVPAVDPTLAKVEKADDENVIRAAGFVIGQILHDKAQPYVRDYAKRQNNRSVQQRLARLQSYITNR